MLLILAILPIVVTVGLGVFAGYGTNLRQRPVIF
ncbi:hypothetical protein IMAU80174_02216 [Lactiplantibacillus plantarum]|nr:hypothetical protein [Lactiplantibacillus plantarum]MCG0693600.1 hypothetical protein [Lactiplantibacillus plantarum]